MSENYKFPSIKEKLSQEQLSGVGAVILAFTEAEVFIDIILAHSVGIREEALHVTTRINGLEAKIDIIAASLEHILKDEPSKRSVQETLGNNGFKFLRKKRDEIAHARLIDKSSSLAITKPQKGKFIKTLLSKEFLDGVYDRLCIMRLELQHIASICLINSSLRENERFIKHFDAEHGTNYWKETHETNRPLAEQRSQNHFSQLHSCRNQRLSLPPLPKLPEED